MKDFSSAVYLSSNIWLVASVAAPDMLLINRAICMVFGIILGWYATSMLKDEVEREQAMLRFIKNINEEKGKES